MKKILITLIAFIVIALAWTSFYKREVMLAPVVTHTATSSIETTTITVDYSKLEKDTIYTEEEGKYENLPSEGKKLLEHLVGMPECVTNPVGTYCDQNRLIIKDSTILSLKKDFLLYNAPNGKGGSHFAIFDLKKRSSINEEIFAFNNHGIRGNKIVILEDPDAKGLLYYRPGENIFNKLAYPNVLGKDETFLNSMACCGYVVGKIVGEKLILSVFKSGGFTPPYMNEVIKKDREVELDLSNLP